ncbi:MAG: C-GCAxxG-C-C family protein [Desulfobacterales bacterium]|jgi:C_GCAxxG_C_C family probable redox protein
MTTKAFVRSRVAMTYWQEDINCAATSLKVLAEAFGVGLAPQVIAAATGMHGAGRYGAQCGLVEGALMFAGIYGRIHGLPEETVADACRRFAALFEKRFGSLQCRVLRPQGFKEGHPSHLCEPITNDALMVAIDFIRQWQPSALSAGRRWKAGPSPSP